jgi:tRNA (guanine-N7-)-methyltransferase
MDWTAYYPAFASQDRNVEIADIGCGFGGLLFALAPRFPEKILLGKYNLSYTGRTCAD